MVQKIQAERANSDAVEARISLLNARIDRFETEKEHMNTMMLDLQRKIMSIKHENALYENAEATQN